MDEAQADERDNAVAGSLTEQRDLERRSEKFMQLLKAEALTAIRTGLRKPAR